MHRRGGPPDSEYYDLLGVPTDASEDQIKTAYKKLARQYHPDRLVGKDPEEVEAANAKFQAIASAYAVLVDPQQRSKYDAMGKEGLERGAGRSPFSAFFGEDDDAPQKGKSLKKNLVCTLADLYNGKEISLEASRQVICSVCSGSGSSRPGVDATCKGCRGQGVTVQMLRQGFTVFQQQVPCDDCDGSGFCIPPEDMCQKCSGQRTLEEAKTVKVEIEKGMSWGQRLCFYGEGDQQPDGVHGDLYVQLVPPADQEKADLQRDGNNLIMQKKISLVDALCGSPFIFEHFDGRKLLCELPTPGIVQTADKKKIIGAGMPVMNQPGKFGDLFLIFLVMLPESVTPEQIAALKAIWPQAPLEFKEDEVTKVVLEHLSEDELEEEEPEEEHEHEGGPSCVSQ
jgi:DnaJ family protein A protein 2